MNNKKSDRSPTTIGTYGLTMQKALQANGCGGPVRVIACIEDQDIIDRILAHLRDKE